ncbi:MAG: D-alanyl-D-alanine carboxypeptidase/D-alanyl-D-alanine-endopeptidase, partial [Planctomycetes bacterium]|nr:D-alanyl-D-alanine carboxypeptidase/D-alanyl-D-alanine-endopeptidase [Planctomycetota bacterium]
FFDDPRTVFRQLAKTLKEQGVSRIRGDVIGDDDAFEEPTWGFGVTLEDLPHYYAAKVGALQLDENYIDIRVVAPKEAGAPVRLEPRLPTRYFEIENAVVVTDKGASWVEVSRDPGSRRVRVFGRVKPGDPTREVAPSVPDPTAFYLTVLVEVLEEAGIVVEGRAVDADDIEGWQSGAPKAAAVMSHRSPPLSAILKLFLERSQNLYGETLVRAMGRQRFREGSFLAGRRAVQATLGDLGLSSDQYLFTDGSGLSRYDYVSPRALVHVLKAMRGHEYSRVFEDALPLAGREGTLARRMKGTVAEGNVNAKTGTISNVRALSGYVTTADGEPLVFSFLVNGHARSNAETEEITDGVLVVLAGLDRGR